MRLLLSSDSVHLIRGLAVTILMSFSAMMCLATETYAPPKVWVGTKDGSSEGNPALVDGVPIEVVSDLAGHANIDTTSIYATQEFARKIKAVQGMRRRVSG